MGPAKKLDQEEVDKLREFETGLSETVLEMGNILGGIDDLQRRLEEVKKIRVTLLDDRNEYAKKLAEKYGDGSVNLDKGEFTPAV